MTLTLKIAKRSNTAYTAWCPELPGCRVYAPTRDDAHAKIKAAAEGYLASMDIALPRELEKRFLMEKNTAA